MLQEAAALRGTAEGKRHIIADVRADAAEAARPQATLEHALDIMRSRSTSLKLEHVPASNNGEGLACQSARCACCLWSYGSFHKATMLAWLLSLDTAHRRIRRLHSMCLAVLLFVKSASVEVGAFMQGAGRTASRMRRAASSLWGAARGR